MSVEGLEWPHCVEVTFKNLPECFLKILESELDVIAILVNGSHPLQGQGDGCITEFRAGVKSIDRLLNFHT
jgi:hypothetical protein